MKRRDLFGILGLAFVVVAAAAVRGYQLSQPGGYVFDEWGYARDACWYLGLGEAVCGITGEITVEHPPLGKWLIATGIAVLGNYPIGWRVVAMAAGVVAVGFVYLLARRLTGSTLAAVVAGGVLALDPLSIISSRLAMLDVFTASAGVATIFFAVLERDAIARRDGQTAPLRRPWLALTGHAAGCTVATNGQADW